MNDFKSKVSEPKKLVCNFSYVELSSVLRGLQKLAEEYTETIDKYPPSDATHLLFQDRLGRVLNLKVKVHALQQRSLME